jgi:hypothetical protein
MSNIDNILYGPIGHQFTVKELVRHIVEQECRNNPEWECPAVAGLPIDTNDEYEYALSIEVDWQVAHLTDDEIEEILESVLNSG